MKLELFTENAQQTRALGEKMGQIAKENMVWTMTGDLGAGKTTMTQGIARGLGITRTVSSPTFTICKIYYGRLPLYHFDAYRLEGTHQELGFEEMIDGEGLTVIEWPEFMEDLDDVEPLQITLLREDEDRRKIILESDNEFYFELMEALK